MPTTKTKDYLIPIKSFIAQKQNTLFNALKKSQFTGELLIENPQGIKWSFYVYLGRVIYASGGEHSVRRWRRNLTLFLPEIASNTSFLGKELKLIASHKVDFCWEYELLHSWITSKKANREQVTKMIMNILIEVFFDLNKDVNVNFLVHPMELRLQQPLLLVDTNKLIVMAWKQWQGWVNAKLGDRSPNKAPIIKSQEQLKKKTNPKIYKLFNTLLNGKNTVRDIGVKLKRNLLQAGNILLPYIQLGYIELHPIKDLPSPLDHAKHNLKNRPLIICVDDSQAICEEMKKIIEKTGLRFLGINEALIAISEILSNKPDLIFLDLIMPNTNGYEICSGLRKISAFRHTPIIILTANDGMIERVRTKMVGSTDFLGKPVNSSKVIGMIKKHLQINSKK